MNSSILKLLVLIGLLILWSGCEKETTPIYNYIVGPNPVSGCDYTTYQNKEFAHYTGISLDKTCIKDFRDDRVYPIVKIGEQIWMAENLRYKPYYKDNLPLFGCLDGNYYTWHALSYQSCPTGFRVPSIADYQILFQQHTIEELSSTSFGNTSSSSNTNSSGFNAIPAGKIQHTWGPINHSNYKTVAYFWATDGFISIDSTTSTISPQNSFPLSSDMYSCRCIKE